MFRKYGYTFNLRLDSAFIVLFRLDVPLISFQNQFTNLYLYLTFIFSRIYI